MELRSSKRLWIEGAGIAGLVVVAMMASNCGRGAERRIDTVEDALACAREALGGQALAAVSSLELTVQRAPNPAIATGRPATNELLFRLPDGFRQVSHMEMSPGHVWTTVRGMSRGAPFTDAVIDRVSPMEPRPPDEEFVRAVRHQFARSLFMWLLSDTPLVPVVWSLEPNDDAGVASLAATGPEDFNLALHLDKTTCQPAAFTWERAPNFGDGMAGRTSATGRHHVRLDLLDYGTFDGIRLPTRVRLSTDGILDADETTTHVRVNPPLPDDLRILPIGDDAR